MEDKVRATQQLAARFEEEPTDADLDRVVVETASRVEAKKLKVSLLSGDSAKPIDPNARVHSIEEFNFYRNSWKSRKEICMDFLGNIAGDDGSKKKLKDIMDAAGVETDEAENATLPAVITFVGEGRRPFSASH